MADPIKLLDYYTEKDQDSLYGRDNEIKTVQHLLTEYSIVILSGESGTGKTSLIRAGLIPNLPDNIDIIYHRMNRDSRTVLSREILTYSQVRKKKEIGFEEIIKLAEQSYSQKKRQCLIILDQFEEMLVEYEDRNKWFSAAILTSINTQAPIGKDSIKNPYIKVLFCLRSDYLPFFMNWLKSTRLYFLAEQFFYLKRFTQHTARDVLHQLITHHHITLEYDRTSHFINLLCGLDIDGTAYPPHLQILASYIVQNIKSKALSENDILNINTQKIESILSGFFNKELFKGMTEQHRKIVKNVLDTLVGREGLRRKLTIEELSIKVRCHPDDLSSLLNLLIERRTLRRNEENKYELIHDFLSRHFFESFSSEEKHNRRLQDMFTAAMMDYRQAGIFLDEKRIRLFLHYRDILDLDKEARIFLVKSILSLFVIGFNPYLDLSMTQDLLEFLKNESNKDNRLSIISKLNNIIGYDDMPELKELYEKETDFLAKTDILALIAEIEPDYVKPLCEKHLRDWENLHETLLEGIIRCIHYMMEPYFITLILPILTGHSSDTIQLIALEIIESSKDPLVIPDLLTLLEEKKITIPRVIDSCVLSIDNLLYFVQDKSEFEKMKNRFVSFLKKLIYKSVYVSQPNTYAAYIKYAVPDPSECESLLTTTQDNYNIESILRTMGELGDSAYQDTIIFFIKNTEDTSYLESAISSLGRLKSTPDFQFYKELYTSNSNYQIRNIILENLVEKESDETADLFRSIINTKDESDSNLLMKATGGLSKFGNKNDIQLLLKLINKTDDIIMKEHYIDVISNFNITYSDTIKTVLKDIWLKEDEDSLQIFTACKLFLLGDTSCYQFLLDRLSRLDEHFDKYIQQSLFSFSRDPALAIFRMFFHHKAPYPDQETTKRTLQQVVLKSANREYACLALAILGAQFTAGEEIRDWFMTLTSTANRPELRGLALLALIETSKKMLIDLIEDYIFNSNWPVMQKFALYALGTLTLDGPDHNHRMRMLLNFIKESRLYDLLNHAIWIYSACGTKADCDKIRALITDKNSMKIQNRYSVRQLEIVLYNIEKKSIEDRGLPTLENIYKIENYGWRQALKLSPMIFSL